MNEISFEQFELDVENIMRDAAKGDRFTTVQMNSGKAVIISEAAATVIPCSKAYSTTVGSTP